MARKKKKSKRLGGKGPERENIGSNWGFLWAKSKNNDKAGEKGGDISGGLTGGNPTSEHCTQIKSDSRGEQVRNKGRLR